MKSKRNDRWHPWLPARQSNGGTKSPGSLRSSSRENGDEREKPGAPEHASTSNPATDGPSRQKKIIVCNFVGFKKLAGATGAVIPGEEETVCLTKVACGLKIFGRSVDLSGVVVTLGSRGAVFGDPQTGLLGRATLHDPYRQRVRWYRHLHPERERDGRRAFVESLRSYVLSRVPVNGESVVAHGVIHASVEEIRALSSFLRPEPGWFHLYLFPETF